MATDDKVVMTFRIGRGLRDAINRYAKEETRTAANWLVLREH